MVLIMLAMAPPRPKCDHMAPRPRPSKAPHSMPFHALGLAAAAAGAAAGAAGLAAAAWFCCIGLCAWRLAPDDCLPNEPPPPRRLASTLLTPADRVITATISATNTFFMLSPEMECDVSAVTSAVRQLLGSEHSRRAGQSACTRAGLPSTGIRRVISCGWHAPWVGVLREARTAAAVHRH